MQYLGSNLCYDFSLSGSFISFSDSFVWLMTYDPTPGALPLRKLPFSNSQLPSDHPVPLAFARVRRLFAVLSLRTRKKIPTLGTYSRNLYIGLSKRIAANTSDYLSFCIADVNPLPCRPLKKRYAGCYTRDVFNDLYLNEREKGGVINHRT